MIDSVLLVLLIFPSVNIPVIVVFTKYDLLVLEHFQASSGISPLPVRKVEAEKCAAKAFNEVTNQLKVPFVAVSTKKEFRGQLILSLKFLIPFNTASTTGTTLLELTQVTRDHLRDVAGSLWALWVTAQQINARQKVELSIRYVFSSMSLY